MNILKEWRIHHSKDVSQCPTCRLLHYFGNNQAPPPHLQGAALTRWRNKLNKAKTHKHIARTQHNSHKQQKTNIIETKSQNTMILLQDFTQLEPQSGFNQDMIITILTYNEHEVDKIKRDYYHFVGEQGDTNDIYFVITVWEHMFKTKIIPDNITNIEIWSDGGPKHFKQKKTMYYFSTLQQKYQKTITYHFYQSYHGHNSCDAAAAHAKNAINLQQRDTNIPSYTAQDLCNSINTVNHHHAQQVPPINKPHIKVSKLDGIKSFFMYKFPAPGVVHAYETSASKQPSKIYKMTGDFPNL